MSRGEEPDDPEWLLSQLIESNSFPYRPFFRTFPDEYILFIDCPGIPPSALKVTLTGGHCVHIQGAHEACIEEHSATSGEKGQKHKHETRLCVERQIDRAYKVPEDVNLEAVESASKDGVLAIRFPRIADSGREVPVKQIKSWF